MTARKIKIGKTTHNYNTEMSNLTDEFRERVNKITQQTGNMTTSSNVSYLYSVDSLYI